MSQTLRSIDLGLHNRLDTVALLQARSSSARHLNKLRGVSGIKTDTGPFYIRKTNEGLLRVIQKGYPDLNVTIPKWAAKVDGHKLSQSACEAALNRVRRTPRGLVPMREGDFSRKAYTGGSFIAWIKAQLHADSAPMPNILSTYISKPILEAAHACGIWDPRLVQLRTRLNMGVGGEDHRIGPLPVDYHELLFPDPNKPSKHGVQRVIEFDQLSGVPGSEVPVDAGAISDIRGKVFIVHMLNNGPVIHPVLHATANHPIIVKKNADWDTYGYPTNYQIQCAGETRIVPNHFVHRTTLFVAK